LQPNVPDGDESAVNRRLAAARHLQNAAECLSGSQTSLVVDNWLGARRQGASAKLAMAPPSGSPAPIRIRRSIRPAAP
jgi:hypothetical protein